MHHHHHHHLPVAYAVGVLTDLHKLLHSLRSWAEEMRECTKHKTALKNNCLLNKSLRIQKKKKKKKKDKYTYISTYLTQEFLQLTLELKEALWNSWTYQYSQTEYLEKRIRKQ